MLCCELVPSGPFRVRTQTEPNMQIWRRWKNWSAVSCFLTTRTFSAKSEVIRREFLSWEFPGLKASSLVACKNQASTTCSAKLENSFLEMETYFRYYNWKQCWWQHLKINQVVVLSTVTWTLPGSPCMRRLSQPWSWWCRACLSQRSPRFFSQNLHKAGWSPAKQSLKWSRTSCQSPAHHAYTLHGSGYTSLCTCNYNIRKNNYQVLHTSYFPL